MTTTELVAPMLALLDTAAPTPAVGAWRAALENLPTGATGTARGWFASNMGAYVSTHQWTILADGTITNPWAPGARTVTAARSGGASLDEATAYYGTVVAATPTALVMTRQWGHALQVCVYRIVRPA